MRIPGGRWIWLLLLAPLVIGLVRLRFDVEVLNLLPGDLPAVEGLKLYERNFSTPRELIITVEANDADRAAEVARRIAETLRLMEGQVAGAVWQAPWLEHPGDAAELTAYLWINQSPAEFEKLASDLTGSNAVERLEWARERLATSFSPEEIGRLAYDPYRLIDVPGGTRESALGMSREDALFQSADGLFRLVYVKAATPLSTYRDCAEWLAGVKARVETVLGEMRDGDEIQIGFTGRPAFVAEIAGGMERDITVSVGSTMLIIAALFWFAHRSIRPLLWLLVCLVAVLVGALAAGGLLFGTLNVVSTGFAAILLGLAVDYGLVLYQEHCVTPGAGVVETRRRLGPSLFWSALTTACAFLLLNFGGLPGLGQLGTLVSVGVALAALVMSRGFLPLAGRFCRTAVQQDETINEGEILSRWVRVLSAGLFVAGLAVALMSPPRLLGSADPLRPRKSEAYAALGRIQQRMERTEDPLWLIVRGADEGEVSRRLAEAEAVLQRARDEGAVDRFTLPVQLWPHPDAQEENRELAAVVAARGEELEELAAEHGFTSDAMAMTRRVLATWEEFATGSSVYWPSNAVSRWVLDKFAARDEAGSLYGMGLLHAGPDGADSEWREFFEQEGYWLAGWSELGGSILEVVKRDLSRVLVPMVIVILGALWFAFGRVREVLLSVGLIAFAGVLLLGCMRVAGWNWNLLNLMAIPLLLGAGIDYSIHMQLALRRHGTIAEARRTVGRALLLCAMTTVTAFGSLVWSSNAGLASLGQVCATGIASMALASVYVLPAWWARLDGKG